MTLSFRPPRISHPVPSEKSMTDRTLSIEGIAVPRFLYGTAWKEDETQRLTELALQQGFRGIDTANQRRHYHEAAVGLGISSAIKRGVIARDDLFLQTKFTFRDGQDHRLPYDPKADIPKQVEQSFASSLEHLGTDRIDSYVLHGPSHASGWVWPTGMPGAPWNPFRTAAKRRFLGISNVTLEQLQGLCKKARVLPRFVQNRCYAVRGWDRAVREFCSANQLVYQGFSLLTANRQEIAHPEFIRIAKRHGRSPSQMVFRFALEVGMIPLTGTTSPAHMRDDLDIFDFQLDLEEVEWIDRLAGT